MAASLLPSLSKFFESLANVFQAELLRNSTVPFRGHDGNEGPAIPS